MFELDDVTMSVLFFHDKDEEYEQRLETLRKKFLLEFPQNYNMRNIKSDNKVTIPIVKKTKFNQ